MKFRAAFKKELRWRTVQNYLIMTKLLSLQGANIQEKLVNQNILVIRTSTHYVTIVYNVYEIFVQWV